MFYNSIKVFGEIFSDNFVAKWKNNRQTDVKQKKTALTKLLVRIYFTFSKKVKWPLFKYLIRIGIISKSSIMQGRSVRHVTQSKWHYNLGILLQLLHRGLTLLLRKWIETCWLGCVGTKSCQELDNKKGLMWNYELLTRLCTVGLM